MKAILVLPYDNGIQFPGLPEDVRPDFMIISYAPPPDGTAPYVLVEIRTDTANVDILKGEATVLYLAEVTEEEGYLPDPLLPTDRVTIANKADTLFDGALYGGLNAAIQASQNRSELVYALAENAFFKNVQKDFMEERDFVGAGLG